MRALSRAERVSPRFGDASGDQGAGDPFARRSHEGAQFTARGRPLIVGLQNVVAAFREGPTPSPGSGSAQKQDQRRRRVGKSHGRGGGRRDEEAGTIAARQVVGQLAERGIKKGHHLIGGGRLKRQDGGLPAEPPENFGSVLIAVAEDEVLGQGPLSGERPVPAFRACKRGRRRPSCACTS